MTPWLWYAAILLGLGALVVLSIHFSGEWCPTCLKRQSFRWQVRTPAGRISVRAGNLYQCPVCGFVRSEMLGKGFVRNYDDAPELVQRKRELARRAQPAGALGATGLDETPAHGVEAVHSSSTTTTTPAPSLPRMTLPGSAEGGADARPGAPAPSGARPGPPTTADLRAIRIQQQLAAAESYRTAVDPTTITWKHRQMQVALFTYLLTHLLEPYEVLLEYENMDIMVRSPGQQVIIEIKSDATCTDCVRAALGQSLYYASRLAYRRDCATVKIAVYGPRAVDPSDRIYLDFVTASVQVPFAYFAVDQKLDLLQFIQAQLPRRDHARSA